MPSIVKMTLTVTSAYAAASAPGSGGLNTESWGCITLWDIRPWMPWDSRGLTGGLGWQGYLGRSPFMGSPKAPGYDPTPQGPKSWVERIDKINLIYTDTSGLHYDPCSVNGSAPYSWHSVPTSNHDLAFDHTTLETLADTFCVAVYAYNSFTPAAGGPSGTDNLSCFHAYLDVFLDTGVRQRWRAQSTVVIDPGTGVGSPTGVVDPAYAIDTGTTTAAVVQETNGSFGGGFGALWHPAVLLLTEWTGVGAAGNHSFVGVMGMGTLPDSSFVA